MSANSSYDFPFYNWGHFPACVIFSTVSFLGYLLLLPLFILVLFKGFQQWRKQRSGATSEMANHSDIITYNMAAIEILSVLGSCFFCYGIFTDHILVLTVGLSLWSVIFPAQVLFHVFTCAEHYLAVIHPVAYRRLKVSGAVRIRNIIIGCIWLISLAVPTIEGFLGIQVIVELLFLFTFLVVICFCSISVLCALLRKTPGEVSSRGRAVQSKRRVVYTVVAIMGALVLKCLSSLVTAVLKLLIYPSVVFQCIISWCLFWFAIPSSLVLPLLFLQRAGKVPCARNSNKST